MKKDFLYKHRKSFFTFSEMMLGGKSGVWWHKKLGF